MWAIEFGAPKGGARRSIWNAAERVSPGIFSQLIVGPLFHEHRILCQVAGHRMNVVKALPALVVEEDEIRRFAAALEDVVACAERVPTSVPALLGEYEPTGFRGTPVGAFRVSR